MSETGRRERKKNQTRMRIQRAALDLFEENGYSATTTDQICERADVAPATFFRHFRTKDETVAHNGFTPLFLDALRAQPASLAPLDAVRAALHDAGEALTPGEWNHERRRQRLVLAEPALRGPSGATLAAVIANFASLIATHAGRSADNREVRIFTGAVLGVFGAVIVSDDLTVESYLTELDDALDFLAAGLPLGTPTRT